MLLLLACADPPWPADSSAPPDSSAPDSGLPDTGRADTSDSGGSADDSAVDTDTPGPCADEPDPDRDTSVPALLARLQAQGCLAAADQALLVAAVDTFHAEETVWCDATWRVSSADGLSFDGVPELVRAHASVADVAIDDDGVHHLVFNELDPDIFAETLAADPARFWRQGLLGLGGLGLAEDDGSGFVDAPLDLALDGLALVIDPDLAWVDGAWRLVRFEVPIAELDGSSWDPAATPAPHDYLRAVSTDLAAFPGAEIAVASSSGTGGGADPTVVDLPDGEVLFTGDFHVPLLGWTAPGGVYPALGTLPDVGTDLPGAAPDAVVAEDGSYRLYFVDQGAGDLRVALSDDGATWRGVGVVPAPEFANNPSVARAPDGTWWLYYGTLDAACVEGR